MNGLLAVLKMLLTLFVGRAERSQMASEKKETPKTEPVKPIPHPLFKNNSERLKEEFKVLSQKNPDLYNVLINASDYCERVFGKPVVITMIYRTDQEQDDIYKNDAKYKQKKFKSPHQFYHAFDLRSSTFDTKQIEELVNYLNNAYNNTNYYKWTAKCHDVGLGDHFHVQYTKRS